MNAIELSKAVRQGMNNPAPGGEYPRILYRKTDREQRVVQTDGNSSYSKQETYLVENEFHGLLCDTMVVNGPDEAEAAAESGWDVSPHAAHGLTEGLQTAVSAKDAEIAALRAQLAAQTEPVGYEAQGTGYDPGAVGHEAVGRRGPGRPRKVDTSE